MYPPNKTALQVTHAVWIELKCKNASLLHLQAFCVKHKTLKRRITKRKMSVCRDGHDRCREIPGGRSFDWRKEERCRSYDCRDAISKKRDRFLLHLASHRAVKYCCFFIGHGTYDSQVAIGHRRPLDWNSEEIYTHRILSIILLDLSLYFFLQN